MQTAQRHFSNGLRVVVIHDPQATRAAALLQVAAGSLHEPARWPGLAHLLEHLLFAGSEHFQDNERLMAWLPAQGGRLNATTRDAETAYFFECAAPLLADGLVRLSDMLTAPLLRAESVRQEVATIDAECQLLAGHAETLCDAALSAAFSDHPWQRFRVGNLAAFGDDIPALQQALRQFHRQYYQAAHCTLWLQGPQPLAGMWQLAAAVAQRFDAGQRSPAAADIPAEAASPPFTPFAQPLAALDDLHCHPTPLPVLHVGTRRDLALYLPQAPVLRLAFLLDNDFPGELALLRQLLCDEAEGSLMAALRAEGACDSVRLLLSYRSPQQQVISLEFTPGHAAQPGAEAPPAWIMTTQSRLAGWLAQLPALSGEQQAHYAALARQQFYRLSPLDQLRERALGLAPVDHPAGKWLALLAQLRPERMIRLATGERMDAPLRHIQGFTLHMAQSSAAYPVPLPATEALRFYPQAATLPQPELPERQVPLRAYPLAAQGMTALPVLLLAPLSSLRPAAGTILQAALRPLAGSLAHQGGELVVSCQQGLWLLQLSGSPAQLLSTLAALSQRLRHLPAVVRAAGEHAYLMQQQKNQSDIAIRALLTLLPDCLLTQETADRAPRPGRSGSDMLHADSGWQAVLYGGDSTLHQQLARLLTAFPAPVTVSAPRYLASARRTYQVVTGSEDHATLLFCPLEEDSPVCLAAWQMLAVCYQPAFFQQLRVEQKVGYVVSCRFYQAAGQSGILFALQSPHLTPRELFSRITAFLHGMTAPLAAIGPSALAASATGVLADLYEQPSDALAQTLQHWLHQRYQLDRLQAAHFRALTPERLRYWHQRLCAGEARWWRISNLPRLAE